MNLNRRLFLGLLPGGAALLGVKMEAKAPPLSEYTVHTVGADVYISHCLQAIEHLMRLKQLALTEMLEQPCVWTGPTNLSVEQEREALRFYAGEQWGPKELDRRRRAGRPSLVSNRLPEIVNRMCHGELPEQMRRNVAIKVVRRNRDMQRVYNYCISELVAMSTHS